MGTIDNYYLVELPWERIYWTSKNEGKIITASDGKRYFIPQENSCFSIDNTANPNVDKHKLCAEKFGNHKFLILEEKKDTLKIVLSIAYVKAKDVVPMMDKIPCNILKGNDKKEN